MKTIKVQIALAVDADGSYYAWCSNEHSYRYASCEVLAYIRDDIAREVYCVEAEVPVPEEPALVVVQGKVVDVDTKP